MITVNKVINRYNLNSIFKYKKILLLLPSANYTLCNRIKDTNRNATNFVFDIEKEELAFRESLSDVLGSLLKNSLFKEVPEVEKWLNKLMCENLIGGKKRRGFSTVMAYGMTENPDKVNEHTLYLARTLGWCVEMAYGLILDDIMDGSWTRRGNVCWYRRPDVGLSCAINDSTLVYNSMFEILKTHFRNTPTYVEMFHLITEIMSLTAAGQYLDNITAKCPKDYSKFTIERYDSIVKYKSAYYTFNLPVNLGLLLTTNIERKMFEPINEICLKLGRLFQMQDDYIDCYGDETVTGKMGTDIQAGKCTWLAVRALQLCGTKQRNVFEVCYGSPEPAHIERIKRLYDELQIPTIYREEEQTLYNNILQETSSIPRNAIRQLLTALLGITFKRQL